MKDTFIIYTSFYEPISKLSDEQLGRLFRAIFLYNMDEEIEISGDIEMAFGFFKNQLDVDKRRYQKMVERNRANGVKGGAPKGNKNAQKQPKTTQTTEWVKNNPNNPKQPKQPKTSYYDYEYDYNNIKKIDNKLSIKEKTTKTTTVFHPPSVEEVRNYILEKNYQVDAEAFVAYYESNGWMVGRNKMKDWKSAVVTWQKKERQLVNNNNNINNKQLILSNYGQQGTSKNGADKQAAISRQNDIFDDIIQKADEEWFAEHGQPDDSDVEEAQPEAIH